MLYNQKLLINEETCKCKKIANIVVQIFVITHEFHLTQGNFYIRIT